MEALILLIALTAVFGVLVLPALRRRRERQEFERAAAQADAATARGGGVSLGKAGDAAGPSAGLVPVDQLDLRLPGPDDALVEALDEVRATGGWRPAGQLLALTDDSELRWQRVQSLAGAAAMELAEWRAAGGDPEKGRPGAGWLRDWRTEEPRDPGGAQVYAQFLVWQAMADPGAAEYRIVLEEARTVCEEAAGLAPDDPVPHIVELAIARGLDYAREEFDAVWRRVTEREPQHMGAHLAALPYLSEKWHGSRKDAEGFAAAAAGSAKPGSLLPALPLFAVYDHLPDLQHSPGMYQGAVVMDAIEAAQFALNNVRDDHPVRPHVHHLLLCFLVRAERYPEAAEQVRAIDGYVGAIPWVDGENPAAEYAAYRAIAIAGR
ncbi:hypothetical protein SAMN06297387_104272 [Streptomyces zhaozhouensis]|uniref:DUF4034 domain-containing protein n=1 Tax=Streptomyces zhaozhouensis TaxID=1300267 RepID=A0A286DTU6_9ACTN|nr:hypothetical protein [Streptomyces zhaozhouensis]SOD62102.1 hypothetical protein SAMN06297387_104272 [Streptomyces zhaozhouensis]